MPLNVLAPLAPPPTMASYTTPSPAASGASASGPPPLPGAAVGDVVEAPSRSDDLGAATSGSTVTAAADEGGGVQPSNVVIGEPKRATVVGGPSASIPGSPGTTSGADVATQVAAGPPGVSPSTAEAVASAGVPFASAQDRVLVPREAVGFVIGKSGETIKEMMARTGAHIEVDRGDVDPATPTRVFNILGDARACAAARTLIGEKVTGVLHNKPTSAAGIPNVLLPGTANSRELWVPGDRVGSIIGARGQVVRRLQEQSGATIVIHNERVNASAEKLVTIVGGVTELDHATTLIEDVIRKPRQPSLPAYPAALTGQVRDIHAHARPVVVVANQRGVALLCITLSLLHVCCDRLLGLDSVVFGKRLFPTRVSRMWRPAVPSTCFTTWSTAKLSVWVGSDAAARGACFSC